MARMNNGPTFSDYLDAHIATLEKKSKACKTEEATKMGLIVPMLQLWGYDPFNPLEVEPEFTADIGTKKKEKVDYAIKDADENPIILIECKVAGEKLDSHGDQLFRYFAALPTAKLGILTNGVDYWFFSDTEADNVMDLKPFLKINLLNLKGNERDQLKKMCKEGFSFEDLVPAIESLARKRRILDAVSEAFNNPDEELIRYFISRTYDGKQITKKVVTDWTEPIKEGIRTYLSDAVNTKLQKALDGNNSQGEEEQTNKDGIVTTEEEINAHRIVQAICSELVPFDSVNMRDAKSYCAILYTDNNRKPIIRFYFDVSNKYVVIFDTKDGTKVPVSQPEDLFASRDLILKAVKNYL